MQLDLNLLIGLDALLETGSVGAAAERLHLSQPAMSRTLSRIRNATGDLILVRSGRSMLPTPYAIAVQAEVHALVQQARAVLSPRRDLDLATLERTFTLRCHDAVTAALAPELIADVRELAPGVRLRFLAESSVDFSDLHLGHSDFEIGSASPATADFSCEDLGDDVLVIALRADNPLGRGVLSPARYAAAEHITISRRGRLSDPVDTALESLGLVRHVVASAPTSAAGLRIVSTSDTVVAVPASMCAREILARGLITRPLPVDVPPVRIMLSWHRRYDTDVAHGWMCQLIKDALLRATQPLPAGRA
jgi:DNA-binding transcriptional LysR family regulator